MNNSAMILACPNCHATEHTTSFKIPVRATIYQGIFREPGGVFEYEAYDTDDVEMDDDPVELYCPECGKRFDPPDWMELQD